MINAYTYNTLVLVKELCNGCRMCYYVCPHGVFEINGKIVDIIKKEACMECGACQLNCPTEAITVDSGVGCAVAMFVASLKRKKEPVCG
jgi:ferredoxin